MDIDYEFTKNAVLVVLPVIIGIIGTKLLVNSWQIRKEKFQLRKDILSQFEETWPTSSTQIYGLYYKIISEYTTIPDDVEFIDEKIRSVWEYPENESDKPYNKFRENLRKLDDENLIASSKANAFRGVIVLYYKDSEEIVEILDSIKNKLGAFYLRVKRMVFAKNLDELKRSNNELLDLRPIIRTKIHLIEKILVDSELKNPKA